MALCECHEADRAVAMFVVWPSAEPKLLFSALSVHWRILEVIAEHAIFFELSPLW
jgi:hypothetical protein